MSSGGGPSEGRGADGRGAEALQLRGLLGLARLVREPTELGEVLAAVATLIADTLGFGTVVINLYRPDTDEYEVTTVHGNPRARAVLLGDVTSAETWAPMLDLRFRRRGTFFVPAGALSWDPEVTAFTPEPTGRQDDEAWQPEDALFVTLDGSGEGHYGIISVDEPASGRRPDDRHLDVLSAVAVHAALAIESAGQIEQLQLALQRHQAVIDSTLDGVIAIDSRGRVLEFNPAAQRMFGYTRPEAIGRELAELIVVPEDRDGHRRALKRAFREHDWRLLDRRLEMTGMRSDGSCLRTELTLTLVDAPRGAGGVVYGFVRDVSERRRGEEELAYLAYHDPLTGLPNRTLVEQQLELALARARRTRGAIALMFMDLDDFKDANDRFGHATGDQILAAVATRLRGALRDTDVLARQGGDEFVLLLADLEGDAAAAAEAVGTKLLDALREPFVLAGAELRIGASLGVSVYPDDAEDTETLLRHADAAMYAAKAGGGGRLIFHRRADAAVSRRTSVSAQLRHAMTHSELELHYEPICPPDKDRRVAGLEAHLRWRHPERGLLAPEAFLNLAEYRTIGDDLVDWTLREACLQAAKWQRQGLLPSLSLNVSPHQLLGPGLARRLREILARHDLEPNRFMIELTESAWTVDAAETLSVVAELRSGGTRLAIDDFGAGYSSLSRLRELDFDVIKVDPGLLTDVPGDRTAVAILRAVVDLARACRADVVAAGVRNDDQVAFLGAQGITLTQGPLFGTPLPASEVTVLLQRHRGTRRSVA